MYPQSLQNRPFYVHAALVAVTLVPLYYGSYVYRAKHPYGGERAPSTLQHDRPPSEDFVQDWLDTRLIEPFKPWAIQKYCNSSTWHPNLVLRLDNANGGIGNVRGNMLDFLFQAIEAGASIVVPDMAARSQEDISNVWASRAPFDAFFDKAWFIRSLEEACPQMGIYNVKPGKLPAEPLTAGNYLPRSRRIDQEKEFTRVEAVATLEKWLGETDNFNPDKLTLVNVERTLWDIDTRSLPPGVRRNLGQLLRIGPAIREYAAMVVKKLAEKYEITLDPRDAVPRAAFHGAHLRTEADAQNAGWTDAPHGNWSAQTDAYIAHALANSLAVSYVASGNATDLARFRAKAAAHRPPVIVTSKFDLLPAREAAELKQLSWDQQALVDYEVLQRCSVFGGFVKSSFAFNVAMTRGQWVEDRGRVVDPWFVKHRDEAVAMDDGVSRVFGRDGWHEARIPRGMWP